jgi:hypothetical protein
VAQRYLSKPRYTRGHRRGWRKPESRAAFLARMLGVWALVAAATWVLMPQAQSLWTQLRATPEQRAAIERSAYYPNCTAARAAGAAPMYRGSPGYRDTLDGDSDGIACEPYRR